MKKFGLLIVPVLVLALLAMSLTGCKNQEQTSLNNNNQQQSQKSKPNKDAKIIRIGGTVAEEHPITVGLYYFEKIFEERTKGEYDVQVYANMALGSPREMLEAVQLGNLEMTDSGSMAISSFSKKMAFMNLPFLYPSREAAFAFTDSEMAQKIYDAVAEETDIRPLGAVENGYYGPHINRLHEIRTPADMKNMKVRTQDSDLYLKFYEAVGANPIPMAFSEVYTALQQGTIDAVSTCDAILYSNKYYEIANYACDMNAFYDTTYIYTSEKWLKTLPDDIIKIFYECIAEMCDYQREYSANYTAKATKELEKLCTYTHMTDEEREAFKEKSEPVYDYFRKTYDEPNLDKYLAEIARLQAEIDAKK